MFCPIQHHLAPSATWGKVEPYQLQSRWSLAAVLGWAEKASWLIRRLSMRSLWPRLALDRAVFVHEYDATITGAPRVLLKSSGVELGAALALGFLGEFVWVDDAKTATLLLD